MDSEEMNIIINQIKKNIKKSFIAVKEDILKLQKTNSKFISRFREIEAKVDNCTTKKQINETLLKNRYDIDNKVNEIKEELKKRENLKKEFKILKKVEDKVKELDKINLTKEEFNIFKEEIIDEIEGIKEEIKEIKEKTITEMQLNKEMSKTRANQRRLKKSIEELEELKDTVELNNKIHKEIKKLNRKADLIINKEKHDLTSKTLIEIEKKSLWEKVIDFFSDEEEEIQLKKKSNNKITKKTTKR